MFVDFSLAPLETFWKALGLTVSVRELMACILLFLTTLSWLYSDLLSSCFIIFS